MIDNAMNRLCVKRGSQLKHAKLTEEDVILIRQAGAIRKRLIAEARLYSDRNLAEKFGVTKSAINQVIQCNNWTHV